MKRLLTVVLFPLIAACASAPDKPMSLDAQQVWQVQQAIVTARNVVYGAEIYVSLQDDWSEAEIADAERLIALAKTSIDGVQAMLEENDLASARSRQIMMETFIQALRDRQQ